MNAGNMMRGAFWAAVAKAKKQRHGARMAIAAHLRGAVAFPVNVRFVRLSAGRLDGEDNLRQACKHIKDGVADALGLTTDRCPDLVTWLYDEEHAPRGTYGVRVEIWPREGQKHEPSYDVHGASPVEAGQRPGLSKGHQERTRRTRKAV
jgi:hypothetical protein